MAQQEQVRMVTFCLLQYVAGLVGFQSVVVLAPAFLNRDGLTHVLIYGNATRFFSYTKGGKDDANSSQVTINF